MNHNFLHQAKSYLQYLTKAQSRYNLHSPFVYDFAAQVLKNNNFKDFAYPEHLKKKLSKDQRKFNRHEQGAGSQVNGTSQRKIRTEATIAGIPKKYGRLLTRLVHYYQCRHVLEMGTSLGLGSAYLGTGLSAMNHHQLITLEGCPETVKLARDNLEWLQLTLPHPFNYTIIEGDFQLTLPQALQALRSIDLLFMDGHHTYQATLDYFEQCQPYLTEKSIVVIDDIHWSEGMEQAWQVLKTQSIFTVTVDLYRMGLAFTNPDCSKEDFVLRY